MTGPATQAALPSCSLVAATRPDWLVPWFVALTDTCGGLIAIDWKRISAVSEHSNGCAVVLIDGSETWEKVKETPTQVFAEIARASA